MSRLPIAARREQLVAAALDVASTRGIDAATVRAVAAQAGVSLGVVHYCFDDKDALMRAVAEEITVRNADRARRDLPEGTDMGTTLTLAVEGLWDGLVQDRGSQILSYELTLASLRSASLGTVAEAQYTHTHGTIRQFLEQVADASGMRWTVPTEVLARGVAAVLDGYALAWLVDHDDDAARAGLRAFATILARAAVAADGAP